MLVHIIADYGHGDLAFAEVVQRLKCYLPDAEPLLTPVPPFATLAAGFCVAQLGLNAAPANTCIYHNVAPRADNPNARSGNAGERLAFARLPTGVRVIGVNAGYTFAFVRDVAEELRWATVAESGSQFRSRDLFPQIAGAIVLGQPHSLGGAIPPAAVPDIPPYHIAYIDGYGNLKTTIKQGALAGPLRTSLQVRIGTVEREAVLSDGSFAVESGQLTVASGSSGWSLPSGQESRWMEIFWRGGNAWEAFGRPPVGAEVSISSIV